MIRCVAMPRLQPVRCHAQPLESAARRGRQNGCVPMLCRTEGTLHGSRSSQKASASRETALAILKLQRIQISRAVHGTLGGNSRSHLGEPTISYLVNVSTLPLYMRRNRLHTTDSAGTPSDSFLEFVKAAHSVNILLRAHPFLLVEKHALLSLVSWNSAKRRNDDSVNSPRPRASTITHCAVRSPGLLGT